MKLKLMRNIIGVLLMILSIAMIIWLLMCINDLMGTYLMINHIEYVMSTIITLFISWLLLDLYILRKEQWQ